MDYRFLPNLSEMQHKIKELTSHKHGGEAKSYYWNLALNIKKDKRHVDDFFSIVMARIMNFQSRSLSRYNALKLTIILLQSNIKGFPERCGEMISEISGAYTFSLLILKRCPIFDNLLLILIKDLEKVESMKKCQQKTVDPVCTYKKNINVLMYKCVYLGRTQTKTQRLTKQLTSKLPNLSKSLYLTQRLRDSTCREADKHLGFIDVIMLRLVSPKYGAEHKIRALRLLDTVLTYDLEKVYKACLQNASIFEEFLHWQCHYVRAFTKLILEKLEIFRLKQLKTLKRKTEKFADEQCIDDVLENLTKKYNKYLSLGKNNLEEQQIVCGDKSRNLQLINDCNSSFISNDSVCSFKTCKEECDSEEFFKAETGIGEEINDSDEKENICGDISAAINNSADLERKLFDSNSIQELYFPDVPNDNLVSKRKRNEKMKELNILHAK